MSAGGTGAQRPEELPSIPLDEDGPVFAEPWEAEVFAMAVMLHERGVFAWPEFAARLGAALVGDPTGATQYYEHWLQALEAMVIDHGLTDGPSLDERTDAWLAAAEATPHGRPILLFGTRER